MSRISSTLVRNNEGASHIAHPRESKDLRKEVLSAGSQITPLNIVFN